MYSWRDAQQAGRVSPFGHRRVTGRLPPRRRFSQAAAPFFASHRLGIHRMRLFAWPYNPNRPHAAGAHAPPSSPRAGAPHHCLFSTMRSPTRLFASLDLTFLLYFTLLCFPSRARAGPEGRLPPAHGASARTRAFPNLLKNVPLRAAASRPRRADSRKNRPPPPLGDPQAHCKVRLRLAPQTAKKPKNTKYSQLPCGGGKPPNTRFGGAREDRTPDLLRARQALSQLSYGPFAWWVWEESNLRPHPYQGCALTN